MRLPKEHPDAVVLTTTLELHASESPESLSWLLQVLDQKATRVTLEKLAEDWQAEKLGGLETVLVKAAQDLNRLERRRSWHDPAYVVDDPNAAVLWVFARRRSERVPSTTRSRRLQLNAVRLRRIYDREVKRRELEAFMHEPSQPLDAEWLRDFLGQRDE